MPTVMTKPTRTSFQSGSCQSLKCLNKQPVLLFVWWGLWSCERSNTKGLFRLTNSVLHRKERCQHVEIAKMLLVPTVTFILHIFWYNTAIIQLWLNTNISLVWMSEKLCFLTLLTNRWGGIFSQNVTVRKRLQSWFKSPSLSVRWRRDVNIFLSYQS